ncbi:MAG: hypothetical protein V1858_04750 [Candidatus Gottesmanbacteria bacterium]
MNFFHHRHRHHHNLVLFIIGFFLAFLISQSPIFNRSISYLGNLGIFGYFAAFIAGMLFVSTFTFATGAVILFDLAHNLSPIFLILFAASGAMISDLLIFSFVKDEVKDDIEPIYNEIVGSHFRKILHTKYFAWTLPVLGALIIISPLPDELGVSLLGVEQIKANKFMVISFLSHTIGMTTLIGLAEIIG